MSFPEDVTLRWCSAVIWLKVMKDMPNSVANFTELQMLLKEAGIKQYEQVSGALIGSRIEAKTETAWFYGVRSAAEWTVAKRTKLIAGPRTLGSIIHHLSLQPYYWCQVFILCARAGNTKRFGCNLASTGATIEPQAPSWLMLFGSRWVTKRSEGSGDVQGNWTRPGAKKLLTMQPLSPLFPLTYWIMPWFHASIFQRLFFPNLIGIMPELVLLLHCLIAISAMSSMGNWKAPQFYRVALS